MKRHFFPAFLIVLLLGSSPSWAGYCDHFYTMLETELAGLKPEFLAKHNNRYSHELPITAVKNQCNYGSCWIYGTVANIEAEFVQRTGKKISLSEPYLILRSLEERIDEALGTAGFQLGEGGRSEGAHALIEKHGAMPTEAWKPRIPFEKNPHANRLLTFLNHRIAQFHIEVAQKPAEKAELLQRAKADLSDLLLAYTGPLPKEISFEGVKFADATEFGAYVSPKSSVDVHTFVMRRDDLPEPLQKSVPADGGKNKAYGPEGKAFFKTIWPEEMERTVVTAIKNGKPVAIFTEMSNAFIDQKTGIMAIEAMPMPSGFKPAPSRYRSDFNIDGGHHQMAIVGVDLDDQGNVIKYKLKNSWGEKSGDEGIYHMYPDYFSTFVSSIAVH